ncbi:hypothetical protein MHYP_G00290300 [Metynnis hypsauchen]
MRAVSLLVLLCCSLLEGQSVNVNDITLSHYEGRENQIQAKDPRTEPPASTQQSCQPDIHSVLREMSAMLAELKVEQRHTTTAVNSMESRLRASESQIEELKRKNEKQSQKTEEELKYLKTSFDSQVENLKMEYQEELKDLKSSLKITEGQVKNLDKENQVGERFSEKKASSELRENSLMPELKSPHSHIRGIHFSSEGQGWIRVMEERKVAFSASLLADGDGHTGPYSTLFPLVYKHVFTNIGNAYNPATDSPACKTTNLCFLVLLKCPMPTASFIVPSTIFLRLCSNSSCHSHFSGTGFSKTQYSISLCIWRLSQP